jgi:hypothetical protein
VSGAAARTISRLGVKLSDGLKRMIDRRKMFAYSLLRVPQLCFPL